MLNYDKLLDDWADHLLSKAHKADEERIYEADSYKDGYLRGYSEGIRESSAYLSFLEKKKKDLYEIKNK